MKNSNPPSVAELIIDEPITKQSLASQVFEELRNAIVSGRLKPGTRIGEEAVAATYSVSRSPAREAIFELERIGLAERAPTRDRRVTVPTKKFISDTFEVWNLIEGERLSQASTVATNDLIKRLDQSVERMATLTEKQDVESLRLEMSEFHKMLQGACPNKQLQRIGKDWYLYIEWLRNLFFDYYDHGSIKGVEHHREIVRCFELKDREGLKKIVEDHLNWHRDRILAAWKTSEVGK